MIGKYDLKPYNSKEIKILRANVIPRSEGDGEETTVTLPQAEISGGCSTFKKKVKLENKLKNCSKTELTKALQVNVELPSISNIAQKLDKVSLLSVPDPLILSAPPSDIDCKPKILLRPVEGYLPERKPSSFNKRREPKFVPYEPYKGCVKPIVGKKFNSKGCVAAETRSHLISKDENIDIASKEKEKVNNELKKLLVASVGEDVQGRVQCLTEDKARMATMIRKYSEKVDKDYEEKERISIQCDVWRSKFLASSLLIDELARWKGVLFQHYQDNQDALKVLLQEREIIHHSLIKCYKHIHQIQEAFDPLHAESKGVGILDASDIISLSYALSNMGESLRDRLLGNLGRAVGHNDVHFPEETRTPGEKMALQALENTINVSNISLVTPSKSSLITRFHPNSRSDNLTVNCCGHCSGEIKVI
ncbi:Golgin-45 [Armadillidium vulgare]|nr:Golgin-45 [Armadillidium vulgare]